MKKFAVVDGSHAEKLREMESLTKEGYEVVGFAAYQGGWCALMAKDQEASE